MIDFSKYTLQELQAITDALDAMADAIIEYDLGSGYVFTEYRNAREAVEKKIAQHVREAEKKLAALQDRDAAEVPAAKVQLSSIYGTCAAEPAGDPPAPPDMFGWVGDALDDLCAAGEVIGNDR